MNIKVPKITFQFNGLHYIVVKPYQSPLFPSVSYLRTSINKIGFWPIRFSLKNFSYLTNKFFLGLKAGSSTSVVVIDCQHMLSADFTSLRGFTVLKFQTFWLNLFQKIFISFHPGHCGRFSTKETKFNFHQPKWWSCQWSNWK